jgi:hypothetical protein
MTDQTPPAGFNLDAESARQEEAAQTGITGRDAPDENTAESPVDGVSGDAMSDDDSVVEDHDDDSPLEDI